MRERPITRYATMGFGRRKVSYSSVGFVADTHCEPENRLKDPQNGLHAIGNGQAEENAFEARVN